MEWVAALLLGAVAASLSDEEIVLFLLGAALGWLIMRLAELQRRVTQLERAGRESPMPRERIEPGEPSPPPAAVTQAFHSMPDTPEPAAEAVMATTIAPRPSPFEPLTRHAQAVLRWLLTGNVPVKVGVLVSFFGIAFLFKHAVEQRWLNFPVELRLLLVGAFGAGLIGLGWRLRKGHRVYALSIQGGGIGVLYLTAYAAFRLFNVLPAAFTFVVMAALAVFAAWLAITQSARQLAVLGAIGGFLAPVLASTGSGSHVALFAYYLLLNTGIAFVAFHRHWRVLNLVGFTFTFVIGLIWGAKFYQARYFGTVEPFLVAHFLLYTAIVVLAALRQPFRLKGYVDSALVFALPLIAFPLQVALLDGETQSLAWSATALALFYLALSRGLVMKWGEQLRLLSQVYLALGVIFATLAVPLWLDGCWVSNTWALEAGAMIFIGARQKRRLTHWAGVGLLLLALAAYLEGVSHYDGSPFLLNERFIGAFLLCAVFAFCAWLYTEEREYVRDLPLDWFAAVAGWGGFLLIGTLELFEHVSREWRLATGLVYAAVLSVLLERAARRFAPWAAALSASLLPLMALYFLAWLVQRDYQLAPNGLFAWAPAFAALAWLVHVNETLRRRLLAGSCWLAAAWLAFELYWQVRQQLPPERDWDSVLALLGALLVVHAARSFLPKRYPVDFDETLALGPVVVAALLAMIGINLASPGLFAPLPYLPVLNPLLLTSVAVAASAWLLRPRGFDQRARLAAAAMLVLLLVSMEVARGTHHFAEVRFAYPSMWDSDIFQAALSVTWSVLGIAAMFAGARRGQRLEWFAGAGLMAVVVAKLFLVDLGNTGSVTRIVSFIAVGLLLLVIGCLAPAPSQQKA